MDCATRKRLETQKLRRCEHLHISYKEPDVLVARRAAGSAK